jgi:hypothetical protein
MEAAAPPTFIKRVPPLWISLGALVLPLSPSSLAGTETLAPAETLAVARDHLESVRVSPKLRHGFFLLLVKPNELGSSQSTPASTAS